MRTWQLWRVEVVVCPSCIRTGENFHKEETQQHIRLRICPGAIYVEFLCQPQRGPSSTAAPGAEPTAILQACPAPPGQPHRNFALVCMHWRKLYSNKFTALSYVFILQFIVAWWRCSQTRKVKSAAEGFGKVSAWKPERQFAFLICFHIWTSDKAWVDRTGFLNPLRLVYAVLWFRLMPECLLR